MNQLNSNIYIKNFNKNYYCFNLKSFNSKIKLKSELSNFKLKDKKIFTLVNLNIYNNNISSLIIIGIADTLNNFIIIFSNFLK